MTKRQMPKRKKYRRLVGPVELPKTDAELLADRFSVIEGNVQIMSSALLGLTFQCARCHDHKFEPLTQAEYYGLQAILFPVYNPEKWAKPNDRVVAVGTAAEVAERARMNRLIDRQVKAAKDGLAGFADPLREQAIDERLKDLPPATRTEVIDAVKAAKGRTGDNLGTKYPKISEPLWTAFQAALSGGK